MATTTVSRGGINRYKTIAKRSIPGARRKTPRPECQNRRVRREPVGWARVNENRLAVVGKGAVVGLLEVAGTGGGCHRWGLPVDLHS